ncbi:MAG: T9SS type A sorting domain-containing protein [Bacteroidia bacterium]
MKLKHYIVAAVLFMATAFTAQAQCSVSITSITYSGMTITATMNPSGIGNYGWDWGDSNYSVGLTASHTYAANGVYIVCATYIDSSQCIATTCDSVPFFLSIGDQQQVQVGLNASPNPFTNEAQFNISLSQASDAEVVVYDLQGREIAEIYKGELNAGLHKMTWTPENLAAGIYMIQVKTGGQVITRKIVHTTN